MLNRLLGEINTKELFEHCSGSQPGWHWVTSSWQNSVVRHETLLLVTWAVSRHLVTAPQHSGLKFVAIFTILTPQSPVPSVWPLLGGQRTLNRWQFLGICDKLFDIFYWDGTKTLAAVAPMSGPAVLVMTRGWLFCVLMAPAPVAPDEGCWRTVLRELSGLATAMGPGSTERVVLCHEESANSLHVTPAAHLARATTKISNIHFTTIQVILNMFSSVFCITCQSNLGCVPGFILMKSIILTLTVGQLLLWMLSVQVWGVYHHWSWHHCIRLSTYTVYLSTSIRF